LPGDKVTLSTLWTRSDVVRSTLTLLVALTLVYLVAVPVLVLIFGSVKIGPPGQAGPLTLDSYARILSDPRSYRLMAVSFAYGIFSTILACFVGGAIAWLIRRTDLPGRAVFTFVALLPLFMPTVLTTIGWVLLLDRNVGLINGMLQPLLGVRSGPFDVYTFAGMVWVRAVLDIPLVILWLWPALSAMDPSLEEAGATSGSGSAKVIRTITLPLLRPALLAAFLISFVASLEDVTVPILIGFRARVDVFASEIFLASSRVPRDLQGASAYAVILLAITMSFTLLYRRLTFQSERFVTIRGRGYRPAVIPLGRWRMPAALGLSAVLAVVVGLPLFMLVWTSFSPFLQVPSLGRLGSLNLDSYAQLLRDPIMLRGIANTVIYGFLSGLAVMTLALVVGWLVIRSRSRFAFGLDFLAFSPIAVPGLAVGLALIILYLTLPDVGIYGTGAILVIAYITRFIPFGVRLSYAGFTQMHPELEEAAAVSGSGWVKSLRTIAAPLLAPTLLVGGIYIFLRVFRELPASLLLTSFNNEPYSVVAFNVWESGRTTVVAAYGVVAILVITLIVAAVQRWRGSIVTA
jgi:iron(III) transport system permease protein